MEIKKFEIEFVERTKKILEEYTGDYDMSIILNCALGLIILPYEKRRDTPSWNTELGDISELPSFNLKIFKPIRNTNNSGVTYYPKTLKVLLQKIRNGLAHQNIEPVNENGKFVGVIIRNYFNKANRHLDLDVHFSQQELKDFALFIANEYLKE